jgi:hypothetical protein
MSSGGGFIIDTPEGIEAFGLLQVYYKMKVMAATPKGPRWRESPFKQARAIMLQYGQPDPGANRRKTFDAYGLWLIEIGVLH